jgi:serine protease AprX
MVLNRRAILLIFSLVFLTNLFSQSYYKFAVYFADKTPVGYPYSIATPTDFLSQRSIDRRTRYSIPLTTLDLPVAPSYIAGVLALSDSIQFYNKSKWMNCIVVGTSDSTLADSIDHLSYVTQVRWIFKGPKPQTAADSPGPQGPPALLTGNGYGIDYGMADTQSTMMGLDYLHKRNYHGMGMVIAVLDAGFTNVSVITGFDHLRDSSRILGTWDFVVNEQSVKGDNNHGTNTFSCIGGYIPGQFMGTAPQASYWLLRTEEDGRETLSEEYNWLAGAEFADSAGADLINSSLGYTDFDFPSMNLNHTYAELDGNTTIITQAADLVARTGIIVCNSAGNSGTIPWHYLGAPADADSILAVGAVKRDRSNASFSSYGPSADGRVKPDVSSLGEKSTVIGVIGVPQFANGTSFSSPILCGAVACLWQKYPNKTNLEIMDAVRKSAHVYSAPTDQYGYGIPNFGVADKLLQDTDFSNYFTSQQVVVYPNPVLGLNISFDYYSNVSEDIIISISDAQGKTVHTQLIKVYEKSLDTYTIGLNKELARGVYILNIYSSQKNFRIKFLSQQ